MDNPQIDWSKPVIYWPELMELFKGEENTVKKKCRRLEFCLRCHDGTFVAHTDKLLDFIGSGRMEDDE